MKYKKGFSAVLLTLIISTLLPISAFAASDSFSDVPEASPFYETLPVMALLTVKETTGMHRAHLLRCANGQRCSAGFLPSQDPPQKNPN